jgi:hypothetical protein
MIHDLAVFGPQEVQRAWTDFYRLLEKDKRNRLVRVENPYLEVGGGFRLVKSPVLF